MTSRRQFLTSSLAAITSAGWVGTLRAADADEASTRVETGPKPESIERPRVAVILTEFTYRSHAHVLIENFVHPYLFCGKETQPGVEVVAMYVDQFPEDDMARAVSREFGIPIHATIAEAVRCGGRRLAVDAVLSIGEHGKYPFNTKGQMEYPRKRFFDEVAAVVRADGRPVRFFNDKHLSYRWDWAKEMMETARELQMPMMAGSSVPLAERRPPIEIPEGALLKAAVSIHGGGRESYDFHALEVLESLFEARAGGETGVRAVEFLQGDRLWESARAGDWSIELADEAMAAEWGPGKPSLPQLAGEKGFESMHGILIHYRDGLKAVALKVGHSAIRWNAAVRFDDDRTLATAFNVGPWQNRNLFRALSHAIQTFFRTGVAPYPAERTLLTTGILDFAMDSSLSGQPVTTPALDIAYAPCDFRAFREDGATWKLITENMPEPSGLEPVLPLETLP